jgi:hypothetical protein
VDFPLPEIPGDHREPADRETYIDVLLNCARARREPQSSFLHRAANGVIPDRMTRLRFQTTRGFGIWIFLDIAERSAHHHLAAVNSLRAARDHDMIRAPHRFFVVLDHDQ